MCINAASEGISYDHINRKRRKEKKDYDDIGLLRQKCNAHRSPSLKILEMQTSFEGQQLSFEAGPTQGPSSSVI